MLNQHLVIIAALFQGLTGFLIYKQYRKAEEWGLLWIALALVCGCLVNVANFLAGHDMLQRMDKPLPFWLFEFVFGFTSLASLLVGILLYVGEDLNKPLRWVLAIAVFLAASTAVMFAQGVLLFGDLIAAAVFFAAAVVAWHGHRKSPKLGFDLLAFTLCIYPSIVLLALFISSDTLFARPIAAITYAAIGVVMLAIILSRRNRSLIVALKEISKNQQQLEMISTNLPDSMIYQLLLTTDDERSFTYISPTVQSIHQLAPAAVLQDAKLLFEQVHPNDKALLQAAEETAIKTGKSFRQEYRAILPCGKIKWLLLTSSPRITEEGNFYFDGIETDISAQKQTMLQRERLANFVRNSEDVMFVVQKGKFVDWNRAALTMFQINAETFRTLSPLDISPKYQANGLLSADLAELYRHEALTQTVSRFEWQFKKADNTLFDAEVTLTRLAEADKIALIGIVRDISERKAKEQQINALNTSLEQRVAERTQTLSETLTQLKNAQQELIQREKMASLGSLVAGVAHELNTPIGNALTLSSSLSNRVTHFRQSFFENTAITRKSLQQFLNETQEISDIITSSLCKTAELIGGFKRLAVDQTSYQRRIFKLTDLAQEVSLTLQPTLKRAGVRLYVNEQTAAELDSFPGPLSQIIINLINNSLAHAFEQVQDKTIELRSTQLNAAQIEIRVIDNGCGIAPDIHGKIFDPFFTTKLGKGGSGLGLHICYNLITSILGGSIMLDTETTQGSTFILVLPLNAPHNAPD